MQRLIIPFRFAFVLILPGLVGPGLALEMASGFGADATPAERQLAAHPEPDGFFRELTGFWHGVPGLPALRTRWEGFAAEDTGFAVLAALVSEAEGQPEEALEKLRGLPGSSARWNEGRLLALLGRETDAVTVLSAVVREAERPEVAANALLALTELDCIRGDFAGALERTTAAWEMRAEDDFRQRILERHLSLLVEAGKEREFVDRQAALAAEGAAGPARRMAQRVMVVMADWFTADPRLQEQRRAMAPTYQTFPECCDSNGTGRDFLQGGVLMPRKEELLRMTSASALPPDLLMPATYELGAGGSLPLSLGEVPWLGKALADQPFRVSGSLFYRRSALEPLPPLARTVVETAEPGAVRETLDLLVRAWAGQANLVDAETLAVIVVEAPETRRRRPVTPVSPGRKGYPGWPMAGGFPTEEIIWNLQGEAWSDYYKRRCRWAALLDNNSDAPWFQEAGSPVWSEWRPDWPVDGVERLIGWAWQQLVLMGEATPERAAAIAGKMRDPGDQVLFAALCGRRELLVQWCRERSFLAGVRTASLMRAALAFRKTEGELLTPVESETIMALVTEVARRTELDPLDLVRQVADFYRAAPPEVREKISLRPLNPLLAGTLGTWSDDPAVQQARRAGLPATVPHPLAGLPVCPSLERFRMLLLFLDISLRQEPLHSRDARQALMRLLLGGESPFGYKERAAELEQSLESFPTIHPLKHQLKRWAELHAASGVPDSQRHELSDWDDKGWQKKRAEVLRLLAEEEQAFLPWHLVLAALEEDPAKRALRLEVLRLRSPLTEGVFITPAAALTVTPEPPAPGRQRPTPGQVAGLFLKLIADPAGRSRLEPAGNITAFNGAGQGNAFLLTARELEGPCGHTISGTVAGCRRSSCCKNGRARGGTHPATRLSAMAVAGPRDFS